MYKTSIFIIFLFIFSCETILGQGTQKYTIKTVVIDAGHGGHDPGASGKIGKEKNITLAIALKLGKYIEQKISGVKVIYTRKTDVFVELHKRAEIANKNKADLFISIHVNANPDSRAVGTDSWVMGSYKSDQNLEVAKLENKVILIEDDYSSNYEGFDPNSVESYIIFNLLQNANSTHSIEFASMVQSQFKERVGRKDRGVKSAPFVVLWRTTMPSILVETGFITNVTEEKYLVSDQGQDYIASAIFRAFREYKEKIENRSSFPDQSKIDKIKMPEDTQEKQDNPIAQCDTSNNTIQPNDITFSVQLFSSKNKIKDETKEFNGIKGLKVVFAENMYRYMVGEENDYDTILGIKEEMKKKYPNAFVVAFKKGEKIPLTTALQEIQTKN